MSITAEFSKGFSSHLNAPRWLVAYSGGADSTALLHLALALSKQLNGPVVAALHVNHGLSVNADGWQQHCAEQCLDMDVEFIVEQVEVRSSGRGVEQAAREARYTVFKQHLGENELLLQGHHQNDQAETVLFRLFRGAGVTGIGGIKSERILGKGWLYRPLLGIARTAIDTYITEHRLTFVHDESNDANEFDRNYIRRELLPLVTQRWPQAIKAVGAVAEHAQEAALLLDNLADIDLRATVQDGRELNLEALARLSGARQNNVLRFWLAQRELVPTAAQLFQIKQQFMGAKVDAAPQITLAGWQLNRYGGHLYCEPALEVNALAAFEERAWLMNEPLVLASGVSLSAEPVAFGGLAVNTELHISFDRAGKCFHPSGREHSNSIKKLLQAGEILPWHRNFVPLVYAGGQLAAVAGVGVDQRFVAAKGQQGYRICLTIGRHRYLCG